SGSADVLEALGVRVDLPPDAIARCIEGVGLGFLFVPAHHGATRFVVPVRKELGVRTIFNLLGPLTNPAGAARQLIGVSDPRFQDTVAGAAADLGAVKALVVCSEDGLDELSTTGATRVVEVDAGGRRAYTITPEELGLPRARYVAVAGGLPADNAETARRVFAGEPGPARDLAALNGGAAIYVSGRVADLETGVRAAGAALDPGAVAATLERLAALTRELSEPVVGAGAARRGGERSETI
ncbi:MAG: anthranilate phosphoribosyltransferase, partial [Solirubrobacteraceae bacterium]